MGDKVRLVKSWMLKTVRHLNVHLAVRIRFVPFLQGFRLLDRKGADVGDLDANGAAVRGRGMPGAFFQIKRLINRAVQIEHEMNAEIADIMQHFKTLAARPARVEVVYELINDTLQQRQIPTAATHAFSLFGRES